MSSTKPYIGCKISLISKAQNRYEGILYTIDKINSTVVLAKVKCLGTEGRPTDRPTPPRDDVYEFITFRGSDIKDISLCESPRTYHGLPPDPAIIQSSSVGSPGAYVAREPFSPLGMASYNQLAASSLLNQQYAAALALGPVVPGFHIRKGPMVEKAVQTNVESSGWQGTVESQEQRWERRQPRPRKGGLQTRMDAGVASVASTRQETLQQNMEKRPLPRRQGRRRRNRRRGQLMVARVSSATLKFDTDFDFDSSNAQFIKEELERELQNRLNIKDGNHKFEEKENKEFLNGARHQFGPKFYYDKAKSFFDNISSDKKFRLTWAEERKRNLETFGVPGRFPRGQGFRGAQTGRRGRGAARVLS